VKKSLNGIPSTARRCSERNLLCIMNTYANKHKIPQSQRSEWVRKQLGGCIEVTNRTGYISKPCIHCRYELIRYDLKVTYTDEEMNVVTKPAKEIDGSIMTSYNKKRVAAYKKKLI